jgi:hypothetical protein
MAAGVSGSQHSADREWWWDGLRWHRAWTVDRRWWFDGASWQRQGPEPPSFADPHETWKDIGARIFQMLSGVASEPDRPLAGTGEGKDRTRGRLVLGSVDGYLLERVMAPARDTWGFDWMTDDRFLKVLPEFVIDRLPKRDRMSPKRTAAVVRDLGRGWRTFEYATDLDRLPLSVLVGLGAIGVENLRRYGSWDPIAVADDWSSKVLVPAVPGSPIIQD